MSDAAAPLRLLQLNSLLTGGGTDDQCAKLALGLHRLGHHVAVAGPDGREFSQIIRKLGVPFHVTPPEGPLKLRFILSAARLIQRERIAGAGTVAVRRDDDHLAHDRQAPCQHLDARRIDTIVIAYQYAHASL